MRKILLVLLPLAVLCTGCSGLAGITKDLKDDPAIVVLRLGTPYGTQHLTRIGGTTNSVSISPDGTVTINPPAR